MYNNPRVKATVSFRPLYRLRALGAVPAGLGSLNWAYPGLPSGAIVCRPIRLRSGQALRGWGRVGQAASFPRAASPPASFSARNPREGCERSKPSNRRSGGDYRDASAVPGGPFGPPGFAQHDRVCHGLLSGCCISSLRGGAERAFPSANAAARFISARNPQGDAKSKSQPTKCGDDRRDASTTPRGPPVLAASLSMTGCRLCSA